MDNIKCRHILVVDDDAVVRKLLCRELNPYGFAVLVAESGTAAVQLVATFGATIALVVLDMGMPEMDGEQTVAMIRQLQPDLPYIIFSGWGENDAVRRMLQTGLCTYLPKPSSSVELLRNIFNILSRHPCTTRK
jgi:DNA-binding response OmpR family regulator